MDLGIVHPTAWAAFLGGALLAAFHAIPWVSVFLLTQCFGVRLYVIRDKAVCRRVQKRLPRSSHSADGGKGYGVSIGRWYFASVSVERSDSGDQYDVWMVATAASFDSLTAEEPLPNKPMGSTGSENAQAQAQEAQKTPSAGKENHITIFERIGSYYHIWFKKRKIAFAAAGTNSAWSLPRPAQAAALDAICAHQNVHLHTVALLYGPPGGGKSMVGIMLAGRTGGAYCNTLRPWQPGDLLADLYAEAEPTAEKPLIVAFDEFEAALQAVHQGIPPHKAMPIQIADKAGWNLFFDEIGRGMFPHLIVLLTSNRDPGFVRGLDPSYIRPGRLDLELFVPASE